MQNLKFKIQSSLLFWLLHFALCLSLVHAQSTSQDFPTPLTSNEINGKINARDIGDARLTSYFYTFNASQGDVFINVEAVNLNGDIDIFVAGSLRPLTKITLYAGDASVETGRVIYLRKPEKLILRVEGRTPNDNPATFRIKFAGSFIAAQGNDENQEPKLPEVKTDEKSGIRVNSVGTIIEVKPRPTPQPKEAVAETEKKQEKKPSVEETKTDEKPPEIENDAKKSAEVVVMNEPPKPETVNNAENNSPVKTPPRRANRRNQRRSSPTKTETAAAPEIKTDENPAEPPVKPPPGARRTRDKQPPKEPAPDPLANVNLIVLLKDGTKIERPMNEVLRVNVDRGTLTIVTKDGKIERHLLVNVAKFSIE